MPSKKFPPRKPGSRKPPGTMGGLSAVRNLYQSGVGLMELDGLEVCVRVLSYRNCFGNANLLICPLRGRGLRWVWANRVKPLTGLPPDTAEKQMLARKELVGRDGYAQNNHEVHRLLEQPPEPFMPPEEADRDYNEPEVAAVSVSPANPLGEL